jgi:hypothetical protein
MASRVRFGVIAGLALVGGITAACGSSTPSTPAAPTTPVVTVPATPTPPPPVGFVCPLPPSANPLNTCPKLRAQLGVYMNTAIDRVLIKRPELFNFNDMLGGNPKVLDREKYHEAVKLELEAQGVCTQIEKEEVAIKISNDFNEQWNIWTSSGYVMRKIVTTCIPAWW